MSPYVRTVKTASGATAVQVVWSNKRGKKDMDHIGSAHTPEDLEVLKTIARQRMTAGQDELDLGDGRPRGRALTIQASRSEHLWEALSAGYRAVGLEQTCAGDEVFKQLEDCGDRSSTAFSRLWATALASTAESSPSPALALMVMRDVDAGVLIVRSSASLAGVVSRPSSSITGCSTSSVVATCT